MTTARTVPHQTNTARVPFVLFSGSDNDFNGISKYTSNPQGAIKTVVRSPLPKPFSFNIQTDTKLQVLHPGYSYYQPQSAVYQFASSRKPYHKNELIREVQADRSRINEELQRLTKSTIQSDFRPIRYSRPTREQIEAAGKNIGMQNFKYIESVINPLNLPRARILAKPASMSKVKATTTEKPTSVRQKYFTAAGFVRLTTEKKNTTGSKEDYKQWLGPTKTIIQHGMKGKPFSLEGSATGKIAGGGRTTPKPSGYRFLERPKDYDLKWLDVDVGKRNVSNEYVHHRYVSVKKPQEYDYGEDEEEIDEEENDKERYKFNVKEEKNEKNQSKVVEVPKDDTRREATVVQSKQPLAEVTKIRKGNMTFSDFLDEFGFRDSEEIKAAFKTKLPKPETTLFEMNLNDEKFYVPTVHLEKEYRQPVRHQPTTERPRFAGNQIEAPRKKIPEEYYENFKPLPTKSFYLTRQPDDDNDDVSYKRSTVTSLNNLEKKSRVEQVHQVTSALPPLSPTPRPIERYNTSQRFQSSQFDQFYPSYDDVDIYRVNDYSHQQQYQSPSSTPSSNIAQQYRGQTTYKQTTEVQRAPEPVQEQHHRNTYTQDLYSPPPVLQDYNDQYNVQIDEQQFQQLGQPTPKSSSRSVATNSSKDALTESTLTVTSVAENVTSKPESAPIIRRSDSNSYYSISNFGPSTVLLPPVRFQETTQKFHETTPKSERPFYANTLPVRDYVSGRNNYKAKTEGGRNFNSFESLLSSFIAAVTKSDARAPPGPSTTPPTPIPPKTSPETIVRSEIGRIHHDPLVITENFKIRQPTIRKQEVTQEKIRPVQTVITLPSPSSTPVPPPKLEDNDYLAYFVEIEPKKPKNEDTTRGFLITKPDSTPETTTEPKIITKDSLGFGVSDQVGFNVGGKNRPYSNYARVVPTSHNQNIKLGTSLDIEPIRKQQDKKRVTEPENDTIEKQKLVGPITTTYNPYQPIGKWVVAKDERPQQQRQRPPFEIYSKEPKGKVEESLTQKEIEATTIRGRGNLLQIHANAEQDKTVSSSPYKFLVVDLDSTTEQLSTPAPFSRNPENEDRNKFTYKTNPESRVRVRYFDSNSSVLDETKSRIPFTQEAVTAATEPTTLYSENEDRIKFSYKTNPENRFRSRYVAGSNIVIDNKKPTEVETTPKIIVPEIKPEEKQIVLEEPIEVVQEKVEEVEEPEVAVPKRRKPEFRPKNIDVESSSRKPWRFRSTTEVSEVETSSEGKPPRRVVKILRNELKNQRLAPLPKLKRFRKPSTKSPIVVLEDLEEKTFAKENEIHPTFRSIVVSDGLDAVKNRTGFRFTVEDEGDFTGVTNNKIAPVTTTEKIIIDTIPRGFEKSSAKPAVPGNDVPEKEAPSSEKPLLPASPKRPQLLKNLTLFDNRATTKAYRGKFKPSEPKLRLRPTTTSPDSETTPGPHLSTRQPGGYTIGNTGNEVTVNRGTPAPNRGTRPTLKPSTAIVSKASDFIDIYRYPPRRPQNLYATPTPDKSAAKCRKDVCLLPDCNCGGKDIPGGYSAEEIPQLVLLTFDDSVNDLNKGLYAELFERGRVNPNGCPISATFYVSHEWTDYSQVQNLYANGHEIASHSITHSFGEQFSQKKWTKEIAGQREILAAYGGVRLEDIRGMRAPFLAVGGNKMFKMLYDSNFTYDSSMPIYENRPPSWPYTLDYKLFHDCMIPPCPTKSYPGVWEVPMVMWQDLNGGRCSMGDACSNPPTADGVYKMLIKNFERHFTTNRAPFGLYYHAAWFTHEHHKEGFIAFLDTIVNMPEVWLVTNWQAIEWVRDPQPLSTVQNFPPFQCNVEKAKKCNNPKVCNLWHKSGVRYMRTCQPCPDVYPWTGKTGVKNSRVDNEIIEE